MPSDLIQPKLPTTIYATTKYYHNQFHTSPLRNMRLPIAHTHNAIQVWDFLFELSNKPLSIKTSVRLYYRVRFNMASTDTMQWCLVSIVWWYLHICSSWYTVQQLLWYNVPHYGFIYLVIGLFQCTTLTAGNLWTTLLCGRYSFGRIPCVGFY